MSQFIVGDTSPALTGTASTKAASGVATPANLTGATVVLHIHKPRRTLLTKSATIVDATAGKWTSQWLAGELSVAGQWVVEAQVTFSNGSVQTFGPATFYVADQIA